MKSPTGAPFYSTSLPRFGGSVRWSLLLLVYLVVPSALGDSLYTVCERAGDNDVFLFEFNPEGDLQDSPYVASILDSSTTEYVFLGGLHVSVKNHLYLTPYSYFVEPGEVNGVGRNKGQKTPQSRHQQVRGRQSFIKDQTKVKRDPWFYDIGGYQNTGDLNGGNTVLRKVTGCSPNGNPNFIEGRLDQFFGSNPGQGLTGDCRDCTNLPLPIFSISCLMLTLPILSVLSMGWAQWVCRSAQPRNRRHEFHGVQYWKCLAQPRGHI